MEYPAWAIVPTLGKNKHSGEILREYVQLMVGLSNTGFLENIDCFMFYKGNLQTTESELPIELNNVSIKRWEYKKRCVKHSWKKEVINLT